MKRYGAQYATEFSKKQINVVYRLAKDGILKIEKWAIQRMYDLSDYFGFDDNNNIHEEEQKINNILEKVFSKDYKGAQQKINDYQEYNLKTFTTKKLKNLDRNLL